MLSEKMEKALNAQINAEFWSAYLYLSMSVHFSAKGMRSRIMLRFSSITCSRAAAV